MGSDYIKLYATIDAYSILGLTEALVVHTIKLYSSN